MADSAAASEGYDYGFADGGSGSARYASSPSKPEWDGDDTWLASYDSGYDDGVQAAKDYEAGNPTVGTEGVTQEGTPAVVTKSTWATDLVAVVNSVGTVIGYGKPSQAMVKSSGRLANGGAGGSNTGVMVAGGLLLLGLAYAASRKGK